MQLRKDTYSRLTSTQRLQVARHPNRPTFLDIAMNITDKFVELHGDRAGLDDPALVCGIGSINGVSMLFIGHQKGRNTKVSSVFGFSGVTGAWSFS
jgi:acetyl-CoA carboxylase carboxyl transferase subunit alpha